MKRKLKFNDVEYAVGVGVADVLIASLARTRTGAISRI
jgi:hypothetical protein